MILRTYIRRAVAHVGARRVLALNFETDSTEIHRLFDDLKIIQNQISSRAIHTGIRFGCVLRRLLGREIIRANLAVDRMLLRVDSLCEGRLAPLRCPERIEHRFAAGESSLRELSACRLHDITATKRPAFSTLTFDRCFSSLEWVVNRALLELTGTEVLDWLVYISHSCTGQSTRFSEFESHAIRYSHLYGLLLLHRVRVKVRLEVDAARGRSTAELSAHHL